MNASEFFTLESVEDLRPIDFQSGKRLPLGAGEGNECDRCGKLHAVIFTFRGSLGTTMRVGSTCATKDLGVRKKDLAKAERRATEHAYDAERTRLINEVIEVLRSIGTPPEAKLLKVSESQGCRREVWGIEGGTSVWCFGTYDAERRACFNRGWVEDQVRNRVQFTPGVATSYDIIASALKQIGSKM